MSYATDTTVPVEKTKAEIEKLLSRAGAAEFASGWYGNVAQIGFVLDGRGIRFRLPLPDKGEKQFTHTPAGRYRRNPEELTRAWEQACRARWRALYLCIKAKLEAIETGISTLQDEFMAWTVLPGARGRTIGEQIGSDIESSVRTGKPAQLLLSGGDS